MTDETFTTYDIRAKIRSGASLEVAWNIGKALADWLPTYGTVAVLRDQGANEILFTALVEGLRLQGRDVIDAKSGDKVALMEKIKDEGLSGGILLGEDIEQEVCVIELYDDKAQLVSAENGLQDIAALVDGGNFVPAATKGELH